MRSGNHESRHLAIPTQPVLVGYSLMRQGDVAPADYPQHKPVIEIV